MFQALPCSSLLLLLLSLLGAFRKLKFPRHICSEHRRVHRPCLSCFVYWGCLENLGFRDTPQSLNTCSKHCRVHRSYFPFFFWEVFRKPGFSSHRQSLSTCFKHCRPLRSRLSCFVYCGFVGVSDIQVIETPSHVARMFQTLSCSPFLFSCLAYWGALRKFRTSEATPHVAHMFQTSSCSSPLVVLFCLLGGVSKT